MAGTAEELEGLKEHWNGTKDDYTEGRKQIDRMPILHQHFENRYRTVQPGDSRILVR